MALSPSTTRQQLWNYASTSTGRQLGTLSLTRFRKVDCWEAIGPARAAFSTAIRPKILGYLKDHSCRLQASDCIVTLSLYMVGKSSQRTKPIIMFVSRDKGVRKEAFNLVKESGIYQEHPGFEVGHCHPIAELQGHHQIGQLQETMESDTQSPASMTQGDPLVFVFATSKDIGPGGLIHTKSESGSTSQATAGGHFRLNGALVFLTVNHILPGETLGPIGSQTAASSCLTTGAEIEEDDDDECEITGLDDYGDADEESSSETDFVTVTSTGSLSPVISAPTIESDFSAREHNDSEDHGSLLLKNDGGTGPSEVAGVNPPLHLTEACNILRSCRGDPSTSVKIGEVALRSRSLDYCVVKLTDQDIDSISATESYLRPFDITANSLPDVFADASEGTAVGLLAAKSGVVCGTMMGAPISCRLPGSNSFHEVYAAKLNSPLQAGDCGGWVYELDGGKIIGHVVAASADNTVATIMPARKVFQDILCQMLIDDGASTAQVPSAMGRSPENIPLMQTSSDGIEGRSPTLGVSDESYAPDPGPIIGPDDSKSKCASNDMLVSDLRKQIKRLEKRISSMESRMSLEQDETGQDSSVSNQTSSGNAGTDEPSEAESLGPDSLRLAAQESVPVVRGCSLTEFKNRFRADESDGRYAVDVLISGRLLSQEIQEEARLRDRLFAMRGAERSATKTALGKKNEIVTTAVETANMITANLRKEQSTEMWPRRIRIQSPALLRILARLNHEEWSYQPRTFYRPFQSLIYHHDQIRRVLGDLEERWGHLSETRPQREAGEVETGIDNDDFGDDSPQALSCLRAYVKYMDDKVMPDYHRFESMDACSGAKVRFSDLWYLFRTGELVYQAPHGEPPRRSGADASTRIWRTYFVNPPPVRVQVTATEMNGTDMENVFVDGESLCFEVRCYCLDHSGEGFCLVKKQFHIEPFSGEVLVNTLPIYPLRFCDDWQGRLEDARQSGESLLGFMKAKHCSYNGWTLTRSPTGEPLFDIAGTELQLPQHINGEVIVDFAEAFAACPPWRPRDATINPKAAKAVSLPDNFTIQWWSGPGRATLLKQTKELVSVNSNVAVLQRNRFVFEDPFLRAVLHNAKRARPTTVTDLTEDTKVLLTNRVFAYVFQERKFAQLAVKNLRPSPKTDLALNALKIPDRVKQVIQSSVSGHFLQRQAEKIISQDLGSFDLIQGKSKGLFFLLHGVPGVGKTATAEAIAQANGKPLFKLTTGDLGVMPEHLETSLREVFRLASLWGCILLLDEVDTVFAQRSRGDAATSKNLRVSVFLRLLDYYDGVLFLTTNRAGVLDEAFKSRIHFSLYYPHLTREQTIDIWKLNIARVRKIEQAVAKAEEREPIQINDSELLDFAHQMYTPAGERGGQGRWNGRQIRNAFQVALSLAYHDHRLQPKDRRSPPSLTVRHFDTISELTTSFDNYLTTVHGGHTDAALALESEVRNDNYRDALTHPWETEYRGMRYEKASSVDSGLDVEGRTFPPM